MSNFRSCVTPEGRFVYGIHKPQYRVTNLRPNVTPVTKLGELEDNSPVDNNRNFPDGDVQVENADWIFEIHNPFPFKGATFIDKEWADASASEYERIRIQPPEQVSMSSVLESSGIDHGLFSKLPAPVLLALATCSTDPEDLLRLADLSCSFSKNEGGHITGLKYRKQQDGSIRPVIHNHLLFEAVANNPALPDSCKIAMVIRPGAQGGSEIVGEWPCDESTHVYEYLRRNSYIGGGHYAANMAEDGIRYSIGDLQESDMQALRHLYYQRTYTRLAEQLELVVPETRQLIKEAELEALRQAIVSQLATTHPETTATLWGWNFGFDYAPSRYRLHASHQQIHQQYAMIPETVEAYSGSLSDTIGTIPAYGCGDLIADTISHYRQTTGSDFFTDYRNAMRGNERMDERDDLDSNLVVWEDENVMLYVPKAQTSQWELQIMTLPDSDGQVPGNIIETHSAARRSLDTALLKAQKALYVLGAQMVTSIEYPKRIGNTGTRNQPLIYALLPRLPESPGAFSENQLRFINGHYPEDFAAVCRKSLT